MTMIVVTTYFFTEAYGFQDLSREEATRLYDKGYWTPNSANPISPNYLFVIIGETVPWPGAAMQVEVDVLAKLEQLGIIKFSKKSGGASPTWTTTLYQSGGQKEAEDLLTEVKEEEFKFLKKVSYGKWYKIRLFNCKFVGCTGIQTFKEQNKAHAEFTYEFTNLTKTFFAIQDVLATATKAKEDPKSFEVGDFYFIEIGCGKWCYPYHEKVAKNPKVRCTITFPFILYDGGWRFVRGEFIKRNFE